MMTHEEAIALMQEHGWVPDRIVGRNVRWIKEMLPLPYEKRMEIAAAYILPNIHAK